MPCYWALAIEMEMSSGMGHVDTQARPEQPMAAERRSRLGESLSTATAVLDIRLAVRLQRRTNLGREDRAHDRVPRTSRRPVWRFPRAGLEFRRGVQVPRSRPRVCEAALPWRGTAWRKLP